MTFSAQRQVALVLAVFVVDHHNHAADRISRRIWDVSKWQLGAHIEPILANIPEEAVYAVNIIEGFHG